ncbi:hypothetical protein BN1049_01277 [Pseudomonas saudimassiliensis]|uniref:Uncharacterized protein n=1 Tax=Pseudomonas saudimassiliensis TaxID=1461581 RepID=A0A078MCB8_9PSED|nr:hypothetical protein BN1049_01277 [Pseudomonas saudimassiliensis]CEF26348.1 hypothetical protein BN1049_01277 [Pseudomonas saudimassiliensis]
MTMDLVIASQVQNEKRLANLRAFLMMVPAPRVELGTY